MPEGISVGHEWYERVSAAQRAHYLAALRFSRFNLWLGVSVVLLSTSVGTAVFVSLEARPEPAIQVLVGLCSLLAGVLAALQTFLGFEEKAEKHRIAGAKYGALGRELEEILNAERNDFLAALPSVRRSLDELALESPHVPLSIFRRAGFPLRKSRRGRGEV